MNVTKLINTNILCSHCHSTSDTLTAFTVTINDTVIVLCEECKHDLTYELISN